MKLYLWAGKDMAGLLSGTGASTRFGESELRPYQVDAFQAVSHDLEVSGRSLLVLATGLGKTVIAGNVIDAFIAKHPDAKVLMLAHTRELVEQLERAIWRCLPKTVSTQQLKGDEKPESLPGVTVATIQTAVGYVRSGFRPNLIVIDEAHHAGADGQYAEILELAEGAARLGVTATPWRGDAFDVSHHFGLPSYKLGIEEGMRLGYLADVQYELFCDNIDWDFVKSHSENSYSIRELNSKLFIPHRDEQIRNHLISTWDKTKHPRGIVFCQSIEHATRMTNLLRAIPFWSNATLLHNEMRVSEQKANLARFRLGQVPLLVAVDMLNEGVDVPDVNIVCFVRVTHSRRIFVQQLGRGLRLSPGKSHVSVLDFVGDLRRVAAALSLRKAVVGEVEEVHFGASHVIEFESQESESFFVEWINDAASLDTQADEYRLNFPGYN
jgi:superfamily II DNA or RNA helicase